MLFFISSSFYLPDPCIAITREWPYHLVVPATMQNMPIVDTADNATY